jgi:LemA protein
MSTGAIVGIAAGVVLVMSLALLYNGLVSSRNRCEEAWSGIDVQLRRRHDLVPNLVETVRGYAEHERSVLEATTQARATAVAATGIGPVGAAEGALSSALGQLRLVAERYPQLKAAENFSALQRQLVEIEDEIQAARRIYNSNVQIYNTRIQSVPGVVIAGPLNFAARDFFELGDAAAAQPVPVAFDAGTA